MCSNKMIRRTTRAFRGGGRRARHRIDNHSGRTCRRRRGNDHTAPRPWRSAPTSPPGGVFRHLCLHLFEIYRLTSQGTLRAGSGGLQLTSVDRPLGPRIKLDWTTRAASSRPHPNGTRRVMPEHDRVGSRSMAIRGYVPVEPATQCEGTCARDCNYLISAVVTKPGSTAQREMLSLRCTD